ncbi:MAG: hypothetical protein AAFV69_06710 [Pseudomonadota bacterium]
MDIKQQPDGPPSRPDSKIPKLIWFLGLNCGIGIAVGVVFVSAIYQINLAGIRDLLLASSEPFLPLFILYVSSALTFGSLNMGVAVMSLAWDAPSDGDSSGR